MIQGIPSRQTLGGVDVQEMIDEILGLWTHTRPILLVELIVSVHDGVHFVDARFILKRWVSAEKEESNDADGPHVDRLTVANLFEDFGGHVTWSTARGGQNVELVGVNDARQAKVGDEQVRVLFGGAEEEILRFQIAMYDPVVV